MSTDSRESTLVFSTRDHRAAAEVALVLEARGISVDHEQVGRLSVIRVPPDLLALARTELDHYIRENSEFAPAAPPPPLTGSGPAGVIVYLAVLVLVVPAVSYGLFGRDWVAAGRVDSAAIFAGDWWRAVTSLTLHADAAHLLGNAGFGAFFGYSLARSVGGGFAWLLIVLSGATGNLANAWLAGPGHRAIGASTAVFAALGILTSLSWRQAFRGWHGWRQRVAPIAAGIGLLAFTGTGGENTDLGAHLLGFVAGFGCGVLVAALGKPERPAAQLACGALALALIAGSWFLALAD